jgi:hypothetical protein
MVRDYSGASIIGLTKSQSDRIAKELPSADVVVTINEANGLFDKLGKGKRLIVVRFVLEGSLRSRLTAAEGQHRLISPAAYRQ